MTTFFKKSVLNPIVDLLKQGLTPKKLAISLCAGFAISCFPIFGTTTLLCAIFAQSFRLNHVAIQIANYVGYPLQFIMFIPFVYWGNALFGYDKIVLSVDDMLVHFQIDPRGFFETYLGMVLRACVAWFVVVTPVAIALFFPLRFVLEKASRKSAADTRLG